MNINDLISEVTSRNGSSGSSNKLSSMLPGGLAGGAAAGGVMALLLGSKSTRKMAKKVATLGGSAVLGGLAYKAYDNWQQSKQEGQSLEPQQSAPEQALIEQQTAITDSANMLLIKAMIAAAKCDGEFDQEEQRKLFASADKLNLDHQAKAAIFDLMNRDISVAEIAAEVTSDEQKAEVYLAAFLAITVDHQQERAFLDSLAKAMSLPPGFPAYLEQQALLEN